MIFGVGTDIVETSRVERIWARYGEHFARRILMDEEMQLFKRTNSPARFLGMRFAGKEAVVKAMGTGFANGVWVRDVGITHDKRGKPLVIWSARGQRVCEQLGIGGGHVSLTDDAGLILAFAVTEKG